MKIEARWIVAAVLLFFAWKGSDLTLPWPPLPSDGQKTPQPAPEMLELAAPLKPILPKMLPADRKYLASFYEAMAFVVLRDGDRDNPIIGSTDQFANFQAGSLRLAIDKAKVGQYPGLAEAIDQTFLAALGPEMKPLDKPARARLVSACGVLSWVFGVRGDE